ncbi:MAG: MFS transporter [Alphaproteobacteria bacterium]|nr:MFS transporter [Alphaproteobacteria bacterium]MBP9878015.1 MFS transporter [Alphaproteobacteria bacterium]
MSQAISQKFNHHPRGLYYLFFAELWERFSYYGMRALLVLYMVNELKFKDARAYSIMAAYAALAYTTPIIGGFIADHFLGNRRAIIAGGIFIAIGHACLAIDGMLFFYFGLAFIIAGTGLFKANVSTLVGQLYQEGDPRRDAGFTIFYMGINLGGLLAPLACGYVGQKYGWHAGFGLASFGMLLGIVTFFKGIPSLGSAGAAPNVQSLRKSTLVGFSKEQLIYIAAIFSVPIFAYLVNQDHIFDVILKVIGIAVFAYVIFLSLTEFKDHKAALYVILTMMFFHTAFFAIFEQAFSSLTLFTDRVVDRAVFGVTLETAQFQFFNSAFIILLGPVFAWLWIFLGKRHQEPYTPIKFCFGLILLGLGFGAFIMGVRETEPGQLISGYWLVLGYLLHSMGELCISPVGLSMVTKLAPRSIGSLMMGIWFLSIAFGENLAGVFAKLAVVETGEGEAIDVVGAALVYGHAFEIVMYIAFAAALFVLCLSPLMKPVFVKVDKMQRDFADQK